MLVPSFEMKVFFRNRFTDTFYLFAFVVIVCKRSSGS
jgi:hypothetical protein